MVEGVRDRMRTRDIGRDRQSKRDAHRGSRARTRERTVQEMWWGKEGGEESEGVDRERVVVARYGWIEHERK